MKRTADEGAGIATVAAELFSGSAGAPQDTQSLLFSAICDEHTGQVRIFVPVCLIQNGGGVQVYKIALYGASGMIGQRILKEACSAATT